VRFSWDQQKAAGNKRKHGVSFQRAVTAFADPLAMVKPDLEHGDRSILIGLTDEEVLVVVVHAELSDDEVRIISARPASKRERRQHEEGD
jgi:uncharacterized DUF497 family protein